MYIYVSEIFYLEFERVVINIYHVANDECSTSRILYINIHSRPKEELFIYVSVIHKSLNSNHPIWEILIQVPNLGS